MSNNVAPTTAPASLHGVRTSLEAALAFLKDIEDNEQQIAIAGCLLADTA